MFKKDKVQKIKKDPAKEYPDPTPIEVPAELQKPESMDDKIKRIVNQYISPKAEEHGLETIQEANDFEVEDSFDGDNLISPYHINEMEEEYPSSLRKPDGSPVYSGEADEGEVVESLPSEAERRNIDDRKVNEVDTGTSDPVSDPEVSGNG